MTDFNQVLSPGAIDKGQINTVVEISEGSTLKIEWNREIAAFELDRIEPSIFAKPVNYGFIPQTLDQDGDELDTLVVASEPIPTGVFLKAKVIGVMKFIDDGEVDDKIICVPADERNTDNALTCLDDLGQRWRQKIEHHFMHYKDLKKPGSVEVTGWSDAAEAMQVVRDCIERYDAK